MVLQIAELMFLLEYPHGAAYVASKRYYFGVGGGTSEFLEMMRPTTYGDLQRWCASTGVGSFTSRSGARARSAVSGSGSGSESEHRAVCEQPLDKLLWNVEVVCVIEDKSSNIREILKVTFTR